jgi:RNA-binding protein
MALTSSQRKKLRSMVHNMEPVLIVGKSNINEGIIAQANEALEARELIKCSVLDNSDLTAREACDDLCARTGAEPVQVIGRKFSIYRPTHRKDVQKIELD